MSIEDKMKLDDASKLPPKKDEDKSPTLEEVMQSEDGQVVPKDDPKDNSKDRAIISLKRDLKKSNQTQEEMRTMITDLTDLIKADKSQQVSDAKIAKFAEDNGIDPNTLKALKEVMRDEVVQPPVKKVAKKNEDEDDDEDEEEVPPVTKTFNKKRLGLAVDKMTSEFLEDMPEYADIVDEDYIKELILENPTKYASKSMAEIVEKIYGKQIEGKKGIEHQRNNGREGKEVKTKGRLSPKEFDAIKDNPEAMKDYKKDLVDRATKFGI